MPIDTAYRRTPLFDAHVASGGRMVPFAGYEMPVQYSSIIGEAKAVREGAGMFDVSHMARLAISGDTTLDFLERVTSNDVSKLEPGHGQYSLIPNELGGCVDDIIVYRLEAGFRLVVNAANHGKDVEWLLAHKPDSVSVTDQTDETAMIAVQGPDVVGILSMLAERNLEEVPSFGVARLRIAGLEIDAARTGYTGEDGFELICKAEVAERLWNLLLEAGVRPCGLGARDTLRVEAGYPLYGHELSDDLSPIAAGLGWVISKTKDFIGRAPIDEARAKGTSAKLLGVRLEAKRLTTPGMTVMVDGECVGSVSSGVISPTFDTAIALAFLRSNVALNAKCQVETAGRPTDGAVVGKRFYKRG